MPEHLSACKQCGACCRWGGFVYVAENDIRLAAGFLKLEERTFIQEYTKLGPNRHQLCLMPAPGSECIFLIENRCSIYPARPQQCRDFPLRWGTCPQRTS